MTSWDDIVGRPQSCREPPGRHPERASIASERSHTPPRLSVRHPERVSIANESKDLGQLRASEAGSGFAIAQRSLKANRCAAILRLRSQTRFAQNDGKKEVGDLDPRCAPFHASQTRRREKRRSATLQNIPR